MATSEGARFSKTATITWYRGITLGDLRRFLESVQDEPDNVRVSYDMFKGNQLEGSSLTLTVHLV